MVSAVVPRWHGDNYQARIFWDNALNLRMPNSCVVEVTFEADGPKAFDDVVVRYDPPIPGSGPRRVPADYHQIKWHVHSGGRFGYADFIEPEFIGAKRFSILERLLLARGSAQPGSRFSLTTVYRVRDGDPLAVLLSKNDNSLLVEKLFDGTTDGSRMGAVRKLWREHLGLPGDDELREVVDGLRVFDGHLSLDQLRQHINFKARAVGLLACDGNASDFRYDELARRLKARSVNRLTRETFDRFCREEGLLVGAAPMPDRFLPVAIRSFLGPAADVTGAAPEDTLLLTDSFRQRYLQDGRGWQRDIRPRLESFLRGAVKRSPSIRLILDAHASVAFLAGAVLNVKSGVEVELVQKGRVGGSRVWRADGGAQGPRMEIRREVLGAGRDIAVALSVTQAVEADVRRYAAAGLPAVGGMVAFSPPGGPSGQSIANGAHAAAAADQVAHEVRAVREGDPDAVAHIFAACPNALLFFLGQHFQGIAPCVVYEFDFDRKGDKGYHPSFVMD